jgi:branched-chain amino acid transport system ATP-binding protein
MAFRCEKPPTGSVENRQWCWHSRPEIDREPGRADDELSQYRAGRPPPHFPRMERKAPSLSWRLAAQGYEVNFFGRVRKARSFAKTPVDKRVDVETSSRHAVGEAALDPILALRDVSLSFKSIKALDGLSFDIARGEICALIGPNGAGKSSLLNVINGVYRADSGDIIFEGKRFHSIRPLMAARLGIGRTFQHNALFKRLSAMDNILAGLTRHCRTYLVEHAFGLPRALAENREFRQRAEEIIEFLELVRYRDSIVSTLPYGIQKRIDLARALVGRPTLLLLDEPMAGMSDEDKREMKRFVIDVNRRLGATIVLIEHDMGVVMDLSHHVVVLDYGRKVGDGEPDEIRRNPDVIAAYLGTVH